MQKTLIRTQILGLMTGSAILLSACAQTKVSRITKEDAFDPKTMRRTLVIAVVRKPTTQRMLEDEFVRKLKKHDVEAVSSYTLVPEGTKLDEAGWKRVVSDNHFDSVILSRLTNYEVTDKEVDAKVMNAPNYSGTSGYGYYNMSYAAMYQPGFSLREETAAVETRVFLAEGAKQVWSAQSKTNIEEGRDPQAQIRDFVSLILSKLY
jgi:hypothetical protein